MKDAEKTKRNTIFQNAFIVYKAMFKRYPTAIPLVLIYIVISVSNSTCEKKRRRITELVTTKLGEHGFGLRRIDKLAEKYNGYVNRKNEPGIFATEVMLSL